MAEKTTDEKLDAIASHLDSLHKRFDAADAERKADKARMDAMDEWRAKSDSAEKERMDKARADAECKEKEEKERADKARADAEAKEKEEKERADKARADAATAETARSADLAKQLEDVRRQLPAQLSPEDKQKFATAQLRLDSAFQAWGTQAPVVLHGESFKDYRIRLLNELKRHSKVYKDSNLTLIGDDAVFDSVEGVIINDAIDASNVHIAPGAPLTKRTRTNEHGHKITTFHGDSGIAWAPFWAGAQFGRIVAPPQR